MLTQLLHLPGSTPRPCRQLQQCMLRCTHRHWQRWWWSAAGPLADRPLLPPCCSPAKPARMRQACQSTSHVLHTKHLCQSAGGGQGQCLGAFVDALTRQMREKVWRVASPPPLRRHQAALALSLQKVAIGGSKIVFLRGRCTRRQQQRAEERVWPAAFPTLGTPPARRHGACELRAHCMPGLAGRQPLQAALRCSLLVLLGDRGRSGLGVVDESFGSGQVNWCLIASETALRDLTGLAAPCGEGSGREAAVCRVGTDSSSLPTLGTRKSL